MVALLKDANADQAAEVVKLVVAKIVALGLSSDVQSVRITVAIGGSFAAISPSMHGDFASALGTAIAGSAVITAAPGVVSTIQNTIASTGGVQGGATLAQSFGTAYQAAGGGGLGGSGQPPPPLISDGYPGQTIP
jgi:hypothetical protein